MKRAFIFPPNPVTTTIFSMAVLFTASCEQSHRDDPRIAEPTVSVVIAEPAGEPSQAFTGTIRARVESAVAFRVDGKIAERLVEVGQRVRKGQTLMRLDPVDLNLAAAAKVSNVTALRAIHVQTEAEERRMAELQKSTAVSVQAYEAAKAAYERAQAQLAEAEAQAEVSVNQKRYTILQADADGVIMETLAESGQVVGAGQVVIRLAHDGPREAKVDLPENVRPSIGSEATAQLYGSNQEMAAILRQLSEAADPASRTFDGRYVLPDSSAGIPLGSTVVVRIRLKEGRTNRPVEVPSASIFDRGSGPGVWIVGEGNTVSRRQVKIERVGADKVTLAEGVKSGELIVALGAHLLHESQKVRPQH